ncbi:MAG: hypothetical protein QG650_25 [Patescibacteria group bacterium]|nr:hypothetical protein [Patescibacteria group bacterium]
MSEKEVGYFRVETKALRADEIKAKDLKEIQSFLNRSETAKENLKPETLSDMAEKINALAKTLEKTINEKVKGRKVAVDNFELSDDAYVVELGKMASTRINEAIRTFMTSSETDISSLLTNIDAQIRAASINDVQTDKLYGKNKGGLNPVT